MCLVNLETRSMGQQGNSWEAFGCVPCSALGLRGRRQELKLWLCQSCSKIALWDGVHVACRAQGPSKGAASAALGHPGVQGCPDFTGWVKEVSALADGPWPGVCWRWQSCTWAAALGYHTASDLFPERVPLLYKQSYIFFLKLYSPLIQILIIVPYHAQCVSAALRKLSLVANLTPANSQSC